MEIKVKTAVGSPEKTAISLELTESLKGIPERVKTRIKNDVGEYIVEQVLQSVAKAKSPVAGEDWPKLSPEYKKRKQAEGNTGTANMELEGDMLNSLQFKKTADGIDVGFFGRQAAKADGHLHFSAESANATAPQRRFLPGEGDEFVPSIQKGIEAIIADNLVGEVEFETDDFSSVTTKADLYSVLEEYFEGLSRSEIRRAVTSAPGLVSFLDSEGLLEFL
jgi:hypothetical protein